MSTVLVTGGTGFIGSHLVDRLLADQHRVKCLVRDMNRLSWLAGTDAQPVQVDFADQKALESALGDVNTVYHLAGVAWAPTAAEYFHGNADITHCLLRSCAQAAPDLKRFVMVSSQAAAGPTTGSRPRRESDDPMPISPYGESKLMAEKHVSDYQDRFPTVIVRPCAVYGPRDTGFLHYFRLVRRGFLVEFGPGERLVSLCHVRDIVGGIIKATDSQVASGSVYFLSDSEPYSWRQVEQEISAALGRNAKRLAIPAWALKIAGTMGQAYGRVTGKAMVLNRVRVAELLERRWGCDSSKAKQELGFVPETKLKDGLQETVHWYKEQKWL